jgi:hypothetical protein
VTRKGPEGSNPSPGAYFEEPNTSLKALAGESRVETTNMELLYKEKDESMVVFIEGRSCVPSLQKI